jgi:hypothetical protein
MHIHERPTFDHLDLSRSASHARREVEAVLAAAFNADMQIAEIGGLWISPG